MLCFLFFFFKQKTAYEMRISDWSSDVCSSDLGRFSFNVRGGRCEACQGDGLIKVEMHFLPDVYVPCDVCSGKRYNRETLEVLYTGHSIHAVLEMTAEAAQTLFEPVPTTARKPATLLDIGLRYIKHGQPQTTTSAGAAQHDRATCRENECKHR